MSRQWGGFYSESPSAKCFSVCEEDPSDFLRIRLQDTSSIRFLNIFGEILSFKVVFVLIVCRELTPIEEASRLNQKLKANYEARVARLRPGQAYQKTSLVSF